MKRKSGRDLPGIMAGSMVWLGASVHAGVPDTLRNHDRSEPLLLLRYGEEAGIGKGFLLGHNSHYRQQFAEKYGTLGGGKVTGLIAHLGGRFANGDNRAEFTVYAVAADGLPGRRLGGTAIPYRDLDLGGGPMSVSFGPGLAVGDSFFVAFGVGDYAHGGYAGDTLGLYACRAGCRSERDLGLYGRNAVQWHNHDKVDWHDFYYQNFTPVAVHLALYPILEPASSALGKLPPASRWTATLGVRGGSGSFLSLAGDFAGEEILQVVLSDLRGREIFRSGYLRLPEAIGRREISLGRSLRGTFLLRLHGRNRIEYRKVAAP